jgi:hypothetical protein
MSLVTIILDSDQPADAFRSQCNLAPLKIPALNNFLNYIAGVTGGQYNASLTFYTGSVQASGTITVAAGGSANNQTMTICGVTFTAKTSGATGNQFNISATAATQAANMVAAINASANLSGIVVASRVGAVVTLTAVVPGVIGNGLVMANVDLANVTVVSFVSGSNGTTFVIN